MDYSSLAFLISAIILGFALYMLVRDKIYGPNIENFEHFARGPVEVMTTSYSPPKTVAASGPNAPSQEAPRGEIVMHAGRCAMINKGNIYIKSLYYPTVLLPFYEMCIFHSINTLCTL